MNAAAPSGLLKICQLRSGTPKLSANSSASDFQLRGGREQFHGVRRRRLQGCVRPLHRRSSGLTQLLLGSAAGD
jgi:hypothetical protein